MMLRRLLAACAILCALAATSSYAQKTKSQMSSEINANFPDNTTGGITPQILRLTTLDLLNSSQQYTGVNAQTGASYPIALSDYGQLVTFNNAGAVSVSLAPATGLFSPFNFYVKNLGAGTVTITPTASTINGLASLVLSQNQVAWIISDGANWQVWSPTGLSNANLANMPASTVKCNQTISPAAPQDCTPQQANQAGFTGMAACGYIEGSNGVSYTSGGSPSTTQMYINQINVIVLCTGSAWVSAGWYADGTAMIVHNISTGVFSANHRTVDVTLQPGVTCTSPCVSTESLIGGNDPGAPCHVAGVSTSCYIYVVGAQTGAPNVAPSTNVGLVLSARACNNGPSGTVQAVYPYYSCYMWNQATGQATYAGERFRWYLAKIGALYTVMGDTNLGAIGQMTAVKSGTTAGVFTAFSPPADFIPPDTRNLDFLLVNGAGTKCGIAPNALQATTPITWPNNPGIANLGQQTGLIATGTQYAWISDSASCNIYINKFTNGYPQDAP